MLNYKRIAAFLLSVILTLFVIAATSGNILQQMRLGLDLKGGFEVLYEASPSTGGLEVTREALLQTAKSLEHRVNALGTSEPEIWTEGSRYIRVRLAGVEDERNVRELLKKPAELTIRGPDGTIELYGRDFVEGAAAVVYDKAQRPMIRVEVKEKDKLKKLSERLLHQPISIYLDEALLTEPTINAVMTDGISTIYGNFTPEQAKELADNINLGALPLKLTEKYAQSVGASLGQHSLKETALAGLTGSVLILLFMLVLYRMAGVVASITLITYTWLLLLVMNGLNATLTLPGIAAIVLGIGMAVDANIITYARFKEEAAKEPDLLKALKASSSHSFRTIMDANVTTALAAIVLFQVGTGAIRGFALTLLVSIALSFLTNVYMSQWLLKTLMQTRLFRRPSAFAAGIKKQEPYLKDKPSARGFDFAGKRKLFYAISIALTIVGIGSLAVQGLHLGVDFKAGTTLDITLGQSIDKQRAEQIVRDAGFRPSTVTIGGDGQNRVSLRFDTILDPNLNEGDKVVAAFAAVYGNQIEREENTVDPGIARNLAFKAVIAVAVASAGILLYLAIRFQWSFALSAVVALIHDAFIVVSAFSLFRIEVNLTFIAALLTIIGYSINDTVVTFDRIRENMKRERPVSTEQYASIVNASIMQTLGRSVNTVVAVLFPSVALLFWGSESIRVFSLAMTIGLIAGMYSSIFIASQIWLSIRIKLKPETRPERQRDVRFEELEPAEDWTGGETLLTSIVIVTYNKLDYTKSCIESIREHTAPDSYEIIVVDNQSSDGTASWLREQPDIFAIYNDGNAGFPAACNQGIEIANGDAILLLNNDTVVTARWLDNMLIALHSDPQIGAVGTVTNNCSYYQAIPAIYKNMEGMQQFAKAFNQSNPLLWEDRLKLIGYNMLIKRHILDEIGELDERFTPGNYEDDDLSYRIRRSGYRLLLCRDTFIHHYGSVSFGERTDEFNDLVKANRQKFINKWGFHPDEATEIRSDLVDRIPGTAGVAAPCVLEIGCGLGGTLLKIKDKFPEAVLYGADANKSAAEAASFVCSAPAFAGTAEQALERQSPASLDAVILRNTFHSLPDPVAALRRCRETLREGGVLLAVVPNIFQPSTLFGLLDNSIRRDELFGMATPEIRDWLSKSGFENIEVTGIYNSATVEDRQFMESVASLRGIEAPVNYNFREFVVRAVRSHA